MATLNYIIDDAHSGMNVKSYMRRVLNISVRAIINLKKTSDGIMINNQHARSIDILKSGDTFTINTMEESAEYEKMDIPVDVVFEDEHYIIVNKPADMTVYQSGKNEKNLLSAVANYFHNRGESYVFRAFYRLDKDTSGVIVIAKNRVVTLGTTLKKEYFAVCEGVVDEKGRIETKIGLKEDSKIIRTVGHGKNSITNYERISTDGTNSLVKFDLETGRTHQIRVHMSSVGHPLCGDDLYGGSLDIINRQALHCKNVSVKNPTVNMNMKFMTDFPEDIKLAFPNLFKEL